MNAGAGRRLVLWRHGRTRWNAERRFQGHSDVELDAEGVLQAERAAVVLAGMKPDRIVSSDLYRARRTAAALAERVGLPVQVDSRLRETNAGIWEGLTRPEIENLEYGALAAWAAGSDLRPGGGERRSEVAARMSAAIEDALSPVPPDGALVIVTHGGSARAAIGSLLGLPVANWGILGVLSNCAWCVLAETGGNRPGFGALADGPSERFPDVPRRPPWRLVEYNAATLPSPALSDDR
ncbi:MAG: histidine phosphatase family protein [Candidatus Nanopelagicales bacterium]|nr:histidine phosphatase family protein [Candidatus Nanopelagicales bacterium]